MAVDTKQTLTFSSLKMYLNCRRAYEYRYIRELVPVSYDPEALYFGTVWHNVLECWHDPDADSGVKDRCLEIIFKSFPNYATDDKAARNMFMMRGMFFGYINKYHNEASRGLRDFKVWSVEHEFTQPIINPETGVKSRSFQMRGKVDGVIEIPDGDLLIFEHKTAASITGGYIEKLPLDFQTHLYALYMSRAIGSNVTGVLYNVAQKSLIRQKKVEAGSQFAQRFIEVYNNPDMFHREYLYISRVDLDTTKTEIWQLTQQILADRRNGFFPRNTDACFKYNRPCQYFELCRANGNQNIIDNFYRHEPPHRELSTPIETNNNVSERDLPF